MYESMWHISHQWRLSENMYIYIYILLCSYLFAHGFAYEQLYEGTNINGNIQLEHVSCSISVACLVLVQQLCKGTNSAVALSRDSGFAT